ncbi:MAG: hypothetical protein ACR2LQ_00950, partial [Acidimicrobiales bacterium]
MHPWAQRHRSQLEAGLDDGEQLIDADRVLLSGVSLLDLRAGAGARVKRVGGRRATTGVRAARARDIALPGRYFILGVTSRRVVVWRASAWFARPREIATAIKQSRVAKVRAGRRVGPSKVPVLVDGGTLLVV